MKNLILLAVFLLPLAAQPHSGGTNANGCHTNSATGDYHCHTPKAKVYGRTTYCLHKGLKKRCGYAYSTCLKLRSEHGGYCLAEDSANEL